MGGGVVGLHNQKQKICRGSCFLLWALLARDKWQKYMWVPYQTCLGRT